MNSSDKVGERLREFRKKKEIPVEALAEAFGMKRQSVYNLENGTSRVSIDQIIILHEKFDLDVSWLITGIETGPVVSVTTLEKALDEIVEQSAHIRKQGDLIMENIGKEPEQ